MKTKQKSRTLDNDGQHLSNTLCSKYCISIWKKVATD